MKSSLLLLFAACSTLAFADEITMKDGDRITGEIVKKNGQNVTVKTKHFGVVTFKWDEVATVRTDKPLNVVLAGEVAVKGTLETEGNQIRVADAGAARSVSPADITSLRNDSEQAAHERFLHPGPLDLWSVSGSINISGTKGNAVTRTLTTPLNFVRASSTSRTTASFVAIRSSATVNRLSSQTASAVRGGWTFSRDIGGRAFANMFNDYEYDKFQSLDLRVVAGGGVGYSLWKGDAGSLRLLGGFAWNREAFSPVAASSFVRNSAEGYFGNDLNYKLNGRTTLVQGFRMFDNVKKGGSYRLNFDIGASTQIAKWLIWNLSLSERYLSTPAVGRKNGDFLYSTGFGFSFSR